MEDALPNVTEYLRNQFGFSLDPAHRFKRLFICEMADAVVSADNIGSMYAHKWVFADDDLDEVALDFAYNEMYETDESESVFVSPSHLFALDASAVLLSERYGPGLRHRRWGRILVDKESVQIEWETLWSLGPIASSTAARWPADHAGVDPHRHLPNR